MPGRADTEIRADELSPEAVVSAIRDGRVRPRVNCDAFNRTLRTLYRRIHAEKGYLHDRSGWTRPAWASRRSDATAGAFPNPIFVT